MKDLNGFYAAFFLGSFVRRMLAYASVVYGFQVLRSGNWSGAFYLALLFPYVLFSLHAGMLIDASSKRRVLQITSGCALLLLVLLFAAECGDWLADTRVRGGWMMTVLFLYGSAYAVAYPTYVAAIPEVARPGDVAAATVIINVLAIVAMAYAPLVVGLLRESLSWASIFGVLAALGGASWLALQAAHLPTARAAESVRRERRGLGPLVRHCWDHPRLPALLGLVVAFNLLLVGPLEVLVPLYAETHLRLSPSEAGTLIATGGTGLVIGAIAALRLVRWRRLGVCIGGIGIAGAAAMVASTCVSAFAAFPIMFAAGLMGGAFSSICLAAAQSNAAGPFRAGVIALFSLAMGGVPALGGVAAGWLSVQDSVVFALRFCAVTAILIFAAALAASRALRADGWMGAR